MPSPRVAARVAPVLDPGSPSLTTAGPRHTAPNAMRRWLDELGLAGCDAHRKFVPAIVFRLERPLVAIFLNRLFATDGWATRLASGQPQVGYSTVSERLARQVQHLLLRFGVIASLRKRLVKSRETGRVAWQLEITHPTSIRVFAREIGILGKEEAFVALAHDRRPQLGRESIPIEVWSLLAAARGEMTRAAVERGAGAQSSNMQVGRRAPTRGRLAALAAAVGSAALSRLAASDVYWDTIVSIEPMGPRHVYDLTVPGTHNFVANDVCVHNTALALNIAQHVATRAARTVGVFSLEMSREQLFLRMLCAQARVDAHRLRTGRLGKDEWTRLTLAFGELTEAKIYIDDTPGLSIFEMRAKSRRLKAERGLDLLIVDYLQLLRGRSRYENRTQEVSDISRSLKALAKELRVPVVALSQLSRAPEQAGDHKPQLSHLRESGAIEQDADVVMFIYREEVYKPTEENQGMARILIEKQRNGPTGVVDLAFIKEFTRFENLEWRSA